MVYGYPFSHHNGPSLCRHGSFWCCSYSTAETLLRWNRTGESKHLEHIFEHDLPFRPPKLKVMHFPVYRLSQNYNKKSSIRKSYVVAFQRNIFLYIAIKPSRI